MPQFWLCAHSNLAYVVISIHNTRVFLDIIKISSSRRTWSTFQASLGSIDKKFVPWRDRGMIDSIRGKPEGPWTGRQRPRESILKDTVSQKTRRLDLEPVAVHINMSRSGSRVKKPRVKSGPGSIFSGPPSYASFSSRRYVPSSFRRLPRCKPVRSIAFFRLSSFWFSS